jgi:hypothetical protein
MTRNDQHVLGLLQNPKNPEDLTIDRADVPATDRLADHPNQDGRNERPWLRLGQDGRDQKHQLSLSKL